MKTTSPFEAKTKVATELLAVKQIYNKYDGNSKEGSIYIEDGELEKGEYVLIEELDVEGRYTVSETGIFKVKPEHFNVGKHQTNDGTKHWYSYSLNKAGRDYLHNVEKVSYIDKVTVVSESYVQTKIHRLMVRKAAVERELKSIKNLLK